MTLDQAAIAAKLSWKLLEWIGKEETLASMDLRMRLCDEIVMFVVEELENRKETKK